MSAWQMAAHALSAYSFGCWLKTPGVCVENDDGRQIAKAMIQSDTTVFFTPVTFGGYSPDLKRILERCIGLLSPYFGMDHGEVHHPPRYPRRPRLLVVGVERQASPHAAHVFKTLAGRNAINFRPASFAAEVVSATGSSETLRRSFESLLSRSDPLPFGKDAASLMPAPVTPGESVRPDAAKHALLIVGSPKVNTPSTSALLGGYVLDRLREHGWETESLTLRAGMAREGGEAALLEPLDRAGLILLAFPLYGDALPYLVTKALVLIANHRQATGGARPQHLAAIVNSGFPETHQNAVALAICREFAVQSGMAWSGGLALGGGGAFGTQPLTMAKRPGLPVAHLTRALDLTAAALAGRCPVPAEAARLMARIPIPIPFGIWRWMYLRFGDKGFNQEAAKHGITREQMLAQPYARALQ